MEENNSDNLENRMMEDDQHLPHDVVFEDKSYLLPKEFKWCHIARAICLIALVIQSLRLTPDSLIYFCATFSLTALFFVEGFSYNNDLTLGELASKKALTLLVPVLFSSLIYMGVERILGVYHQSFGEELLNVFLQTRGRGATWLWYVVCLFVAYIMFYGILKIKKDKTKLIVSGICALVGVLYSIYAPSISNFNGNTLPWHIDVALVAVFLMTLGYLIKKKGYLEKILAKYKKKELYVFALLVVVFCLGVSIINRNQFHTSITLGNYGDIFIWVPFSFATGILTVVLLSNVIKENKITTFISKHFIAILVFLKPMQMLLDRAIYEIGIAEYVSKYEMVQTLFILVEAVVLLAVLALLAVVTEKLLPFILGKWYKSSDEVLNDEESLNDESYNEAAYNELDN